MTAPGTCWWVGCEACELAAGPFGCEPEAVQLAGVHDQVHHRGAPTAAPYPDPDQGRVPVAGPDGQSPDRRSFYQVVPPVRVIPSPQLRAGRCPA
ncbi:MAG TPA: hypothetical protein VLJ59_08030 [Mycobacteriales bacterium]|nr:hypothetical protein [Mycobacteriales bacterium]